MTAQPKGRLQSAGAVVPLAVLATFLWGTAFPCVKLGYRLFAIESGGTASQMLFAGTRFLLAGALTLVFGAAAGRRAPLPARRNYGGVLLLGLVQTTAQYVFFYVGLANTTGSRGSIIDASAAFIGVILAHFLCRGDRMTRRKALGCAAGFAGVVVLNLGGGLDGAFAFTGEGFMLLAATSSALGAVVSARVAPGNDTMAVTGWQLLAGGGVLFLIGALGGGRIRPTGGAAWLLLFYLAALSAVAFTIWTLLLKYHPVARVSIFNSLIPVFGTLCSGLFLGEEIWNVRNLAALLLVCAGICIVNGAPGPASSVKA